jgi:hypothetical protein
MQYLSKKIGALVECIRVIVISNFVQKVLCEVVLQLFTHFLLTFPQIERINLKNQANRFNTTKPTLSINICASGYTKCQQ